MASTTVTAPTFSGIIDQSYLIEPLQGAQSPLSYLDRFPDGVYDKSFNSHLVRFIYALLGPAGVGGLTTNLLQARLIFESQGLSAFDMDAFYGNPFKFGRIVDESFSTQNVKGLMPSNAWDQIMAQDEAYRSRCIDFFNGVRAGNSPLGMELVAKSGLGHAVEVIENYQYLYDLHTDDQLGLPRFGKTDFLEEFTVIPRQEISKTQAQVLSFAATYADAGVFYLTYKGQLTIPLAVGATNVDVQTALQSLGAIGTNNVQVTGGPNPNPFHITFKGDLSNENAGPITVSSQVFQTMVSGDIPVGMNVQVTQAGLDTSNEVFKIADLDKYDLQQALDRIRPVHTIPTVNDATGKTVRQPWNNVTSSSAYAETRTFVTGHSDVPWPPVDLTQAHWIEPDVEKEAPMVQRHKPYHFVEFHRPAKVYAYTDAAIDDPDYLTNIDVVNKYTSERTGPFSTHQVRLFPFFRYYDDGPFGWPAFTCLHPQPEPILATEYDANGALFNGHYPTDYIALVASPGPTRSNLSFYYGYYYNFFYKAGQLAPFWSSLERTSGADYLEIDLGKAMPLNFLTFDVTHKPLDIEIDYDILDDPKRRRWAPLYPSEEGYFETSVLHSSDPVPWQSLEYLFQTQKGTVPFTRHLRIRFTRRIANPTLALSPTDTFLWDAANHVQHPWSIEVRNLRLGRNVNQIDIDFAWRYNARPYFWYGYVGPIFDTGAFL